MGLHPVDCDNRIRNRGGEFISKVRTVVRPTAVSPRIRTPSQAKCSLHWCCRGWKRGVISSVIGSMPAKSLDFLKLQSAQARARLSRLSSPPCLRGMMCSTWSGISGELDCVRWQYSQHQFARLRTSFRVGASMSWRFQLSQPKAGFRLNRSEKIVCFDIALVLISLLIG